MTEPAPTDLKLQGFQDLTLGYQKRPKSKTSDALPNTECKKCGSNLIYRTLNYLFVNLLPFNCVNCGLIRESDVIMG